MIVPVTTRDGRELHVERHGSGGPVVVLESGMGVSRNAWGAVVDLLAARTTTVVYDRSGLGRSPRDGAPRDLARLTDDLVDVLVALGVGPYVLVGHSWGGPIVRTVAAVEPGLVIGLVLVDPTDETCDVFFDPASVRQQRMAPRLLPALARLGMLRGVVRRQAKALPEPWATAMRAEDGTVAATEAMVAELHGSLDDLRRLRAERLPPPQVPVVVVSGAKGGFMERGRRPALLDAHRASAAAAPLGRHVLAEASSHYVPLTEPEVVVREVLSLLDATSPTPREHDR